MDPRWLRERLDAGPPLLLDGAVGTELERGGHEVGLPPWAARALVEAPDAVREVHAAYARAGAELLTADTFRTQRHQVARAGLDATARELCARAVELAREGARAAGRGDLPIAGSVPPLEDCYSPELVPDDDTLLRGHRDHVANLAAAGVDLLLVETQIHPREIEAATTAAAESRLPWLLSVLPRGGRLLSGDPLGPVLDRALERGAEALLVNCVPSSVAAAELAPLRARTTRFGVYPNLGAPEALLSQVRSEDPDPEVFVRRAREWVALGARLVGGCCGTGPAHVAALRRALLDP